VRNPVGRVQKVGPPEDVAITPTKPLWSDEEVEKLTALFPTHSARAIATQLGRGFNAVRGKARNLGLRKAAHPSPQEAKPPPKPKPLSAAVTGWNSLTALPGDSGKGFAHSGTTLRAVPGRNGPTGLPGDSDEGQEAVPFNTVSLFDHHSGQCRWIISDVWPAVYCGAPVVGSSSWCEQHSRRVFTDGQRRLGDGRTNSGGPRPVGPAELLNMR
jgi:hypothetical protein